MTSIWTLAQAFILAATMGWITERFADTGSRGWVVPVFSGILGMYVGPRLASFVGWSGPAIGGHPIVPLFGCALAACMFVKLLGLGIESGGGRH
jgi:uncharacterized membrane protein YeaQ/YmgE (transglycosylase-associated protein family)